MLSPALKVLRGLVFPPVCDGCGAMTPASHPDPVCAACDSSFRPLSGPACRLCARPWPVGGTCLLCKTKKTALDAVHVVYAYDGPLQKVLHAYKFDRRRSLGGFLSEKLCTFARKRLADEPFDAVVAVPSDPSKSAERGFHPPAEFARRIAHALRATDRSRWLGARAGRAQVSLSREERQRNVRGRFYFKAGRGEAAGCRVLLVDDVLTTGSTVSECAWALQGAGANSITALCLAR